MLMRFRIIFFLSYTTIGTRNCAVNMGSVDLDSWEVSFSSTVNLCNTWMEALESHSAGRIVL